EGGIESRLATLGQPQARLAKRGQGTEERAEESDTQHNHADESTQRLRGCPPRISSASASRTSGRVSARLRIIEYRSSTSTTDCRLAMSRGSRVRRYSTMSSESCKPRSAATVLRWRALSSSLSGAS